MTLLILYNHTTLTTVCPGVVIELCLYRALICLYLFGSILSLSLYLFMYLIVCIFQFLVNLFSHKYNM